jgi:hypothetical protein
MLAASHGLPSDTGPRVGRRLRALREFPLLGRALGGRYEGTRYVLGPWPWLLIVYEFRETRDEVVVLGMFDARSATSPTNQ